jgi:hypothetical protein
MKKLLLNIFVVSVTFLHPQQQDTAKKVTRKPLRFNITDDGKNYFQVNFLNQAWIRYTENNEGSTVFGKNSPDLFDIGLRRARIQLFGQITERAFIYFQLGQNNFNSTYTNAAGNRKFAFFVHDAVCEYKVSQNNQLKIGTGLTIMNGLSRFSQPSVSSIMTLDVPVFLQYSVDQIDQFDRRFAVYARGQLHKLDYRVYVGQPFPVSSNGSSVPAISYNASFVNVNAYAGNGPGISPQFGTYLSWNFFENEPHTTPYMQGTYLGAKKIWNLSLGGVYQKSATWFIRDNAIGSVDTLFDDMLHLGIETFLDMPINKSKGTAINFFAGYYLTDYGNNYLRYNGSMNPANGTTAQNALQSGAYGNSYPMFGTGSVIYVQTGWLLKKNLFGMRSGQLMPFASAQLADYDALKNNKMLVFDAGVNCLLNGHNSKISLSYQNRPTYYKNGEVDVVKGKRKSCFICQYQIFI